MEVEAFPDDPYFTPEIQAEIEDIIQQIACGSGEGRWAKPDKVQIIRKLAGGKSGAVVLEARVETGARSSLKVIKIGPRFDLRNEFTAFKSIRDHITAQFVPLQAVTEGLLSDAGKPKRKQAVVYDHAERFVGNVEVVTFETIAANALRSDATIQQAETVLAELFKGIRGPLYDARKVESEPTSLRARWNFRLGFDAVVSVRQILGKDRRLTFGEDRSSLLPLLAQARALEIHEPAERKAEFVELSKGKVEWWELDDADDILAVQLGSPHFIRYQVKSGIEGKSLRYLDRDDQIRDGQQWALLGEVDHWRNEHHKAAFLAKLGPDFQIADRKLTGPDSVVVADPFPLLADVLDRKRPNRITSWAHGDLNSRNILVGENRPCLIDYAFTREGEPLMFDFVRLEGTLAAEILPDDFTWAEHVRLQRFLALACRLAGPTASEQHLERIAQELSGRLAVEKVELGRAFRLLWAVRKAAREVTPPEYREGWARDYVEQLFLFGHQMLKWFDKTTRRSATAVAAILGVTAETLQPARVYRFWDRDELAENAPLLLQLMEPQAEFLLADLASLGRALPRKLIDSAPFRAAREKLVRSRFQKRAKDIKENLASQHNVFIRLKAFIELKGQLKKAGRRVAGGIELDDMLRSDVQLAERERLRAKEGEKGEDALTLITEHAPVVLLGDAGAGKSTVAREWEYRLAKTIHDADPNNEARLPIVIPAGRIAGELDGWDPEEPGNVARHLEAHVTDFPAHLSLAQLFEAGAACLVVDALNEVGDRRQAVAQWAAAFHKAFPLVPLIVCHRQYNYPAGLLSFPVVTLQKVEANQAKRYIRDSLGPTEKAEGRDGLADDLIRLLLDDPNQEQVRDLAQTPLFLWMVVEYYRKKRDLPENRARLFEEFSEWYLQEQHHQGEFGAGPELRFEFRQKADLLGRLGHQLVERRETVLNRDDVEAVLAEIDGEPASSPGEILAEIVRTELVKWEDVGSDRLRFLHQSFQEYFAARHLLAHLDKNTDEITQRVRQFGWHDTFVLVLGFGGQNPEVVTQVVEAALEVNPGLTARCLRMAELEDRSALLEKFVAAQEAVLREPAEGVWAYHNASAALAEYGRGPARAVLWQIVTDRGAPDDARRLAIEQLAKLPGQVRFEAVAEKLREEFRVSLGRVFEEPAPEAVQRAAIDAVVQVKLNQLAEFLTDLVREGEWPLRRAAWEALDKLGQTKTTRLRRTYTAACEKRLESLETELYAKTVVGRMEELNRERVAILQQIADPSKLELLLKRRFAYIPEWDWAEWDESVAYTLNRLAREAIPPHRDSNGDEGSLDESTSTLTACEILAEEEPDIPRWTELFEPAKAPGSSPLPELDWLAAAHRLVAVAQYVPEDWLHGQLESALGELESSENFGETRPALWLSALARMVGHSKKKSFFEPLDRLIRGLIGQVSSRDEVEAFCNLCVALSKLDTDAANRTVAVAGHAFWAKRPDEMHLCVLFPWTYIASLFNLTDADYEALIVSGEVAETQTAVSQLSYFGAGTSWVADRISSPVKLSAEALECMVQSARDETNLPWRGRLASAAIVCQASGLLPWLLETGRRSELLEAAFAFFNTTYGPTEERYLAYVLRSIGYLTRFTLDQHNQAQSAEESPPRQPALDAIADLRQRYAELGRQLAAGEEPHRSIIHGLTVALGYLGQWEPILTHLGPGEPWQHEAAKNVFNYWVPGPAEVTGARDPEGEPERAAQWIAHRLRESELDLSPEVRTTHAEILEKLEQKLGRHVR